MSFLTVNTTEYLSGIPLEGIEAVRNALRLFASGQTAGSNATEKKLIQDGGVGIALLKPLVEEMYGGDDRFLTDLFTKIDAGIEAVGSYSYHYDYDGVGRFFKTTVEVQKLDDTWFLLHLSAAYVGDQVEVGLAESLQIDRAVQHIDVTAQVEPDSELVTFDFEVISINLTTIGAECTSEQIVEQIMTEERGGPLRHFGRPRFQVGDYEVALSLGGIVQPWQLEDEMPAWQTHASMMTGLRENKNRHEPEKPVEYEVPKINFNIGLATESSYSRSIPIITDDGKQAIRNLASNLATALQS
ncbi:hypothetical protein HYX70_03435 [Candidatus Saccharibacteria bacterium]|nr:hypothetical protein [Candidatus Saccharibacteria bacterium]